MLAENLGSQDNLQVDIIDGEGGRRLPRQPPPNPGQKRNHVKSYLHIIISQVGESYIVTPRVYPPTSTHDYTTREGLIPPPALTAQAPPGEPGGGEASHSNPCTHTQVYVHLDRHLNFLPYLPLSYWYICLLTFSLGLGWVGAYLLSFRASPGST